MKVFVVACSVLGASVTLLGCGGGGGSTTVIPTTVTQTTTYIHQPPTGAVCDPSTATTTAGLAASCTVRIDFYGSHRSRSFKANTTPGACVYLAEYWPDHLSFFGVATCNGNITTAHFFNSTSKVTDGDGHFDVPGCCDGKVDVPSDYTGNPKWATGPSLNFGQDSWMSMTCVGCPKIVDVETSATLV